VLRFSISVAILWSRPGNSVRAFHDLPVPCSHIFFPRLAGRGQRSFNQACVRKLGPRQHFFSVGESRRFSPCAIRRRALILFSTLHVASLAPVTAGAFLGLFRYDGRALRCPFIGWPRRWRRRWFVYWRWSCWPARRLDLRFLGLSLLPTSFVSAAHELLLLTSSLVLVAAQDDSCTKRLAGRQDSSSFLSIYATKVCVKRYTQEQQ